MTDLPFAKILIVAVFVLILVALGSAFVSLFRGSAKDTDGTATVRALTVRVALSVALVIVIFILSALGLISPNG